MDIFIVDDEPIIHVVYKKILANNGYNILGEAFDGEEALQLIKSMDKKPEVIIMDFRMPIMNGLETTKELLYLYPHLNIIFISADVSVRKEALALGAKLFLEKPFERNGFLKAIELLQTS